jgi:stalled ribosome rescue protein Dom34
LIKKHTKKKGSIECLLLSFDFYDIFFWGLSSYGIRALSTLKTEKKISNMNDSQRYTFFEQIVEKIRQAVKQNIRQIVLISPPNSNTAQDFTVHIKKHHLWLVSKDKYNSASFAMITGIGRTLPEVAAIVQMEQFQAILKQIQFQESDKLLDLIEKRLSQSIDPQMILYTTDEIEHTLKSLTETSPFQPEMLVYTDFFYQKCSYKSFFNHLLQIASNQHIKILLVRTSTPVGMRVEQLGGLVFFQKPLI